MGIGDTSDPGLGAAGFSDDGAVDVGVGVNQGKVVMKWDRPREFIVFEPQNAFDFGENLARAAHHARFPGQPITDGSYLGEQIKARVTEDKRQVLVQRATIMFNAMRENKVITNNRLAQLLVDQLLAAVT